MTRLRAHNLSMSVDGYVAGPDQSLTNPLGVGGEGLHEWVFGTPTGAEMVGDAGGGSAGIDEDFMQRGVQGIGATVMGRNMFGPIRGPWNTQESAEEWRGWWGDDPPYHHDVFVLTHHDHSPMEMKGGTTFHFVTGGIEEALDRAVDAAAGADVRLGGGASTVRQYLQAGLVDELHVVIAPVLLGSGERLFDDDVDLTTLGYRIRDRVSSPSVTHLVIERAVE